MQKSRLERFILLVLLALLSTPVGVNANESLRSSVLEEGQRVSELMDWDSTFTTLLEQEIAKYPEDSIQDLLLTRLRLHYLDIERHTKSRVKENLEILLLEWLPDLRAILKLPEEQASRRISGAFPGSYYAAKHLCPELLSDSSLIDLASGFPKEVLGMLRYTIDVEALLEIETAALAAPYEAKQYLHYHNSIKTQLLRSEDERIGLLFEIFQQYRYGSNAYYLLEKIYKEELSVLQAHEIAKDRELMYNALIDINRVEDALGRYSAEERLSELSDKYVRKLTFQRYLPKSRLQLTAFEELSDNGRIYFLFRSQNMLKKQDLENLAYIYESMNMERLPAQLPWLSDEWILSFEARITEDELQDDFAFLISNALFAEARKRANPVIKTEAVALIPEVVEVTEPAFVFKAYQWSISSEEREYVRLENNPHEVIHDLSLHSGKLYSRKLILNMAMNHPVEVASQLEALEGQPYTSEICRKLALNAPLTAKNFLLKPDHRIHAYLKAKENASIDTLYQIHERLGNWTRAYILLDPLIKGSMDMETAHDIASDRSRLIPHLVRLYAKPDLYGRYSVEQELEYVALDFVRNFNIALNTGGNFQDELNALDAQTLYAFLLFSEQELIHTTFTRMYDRLMQLTGHDLAALFEATENQYIERFLRMAMHYGKEYDLYRRISAEARINLFRDVFTGLTRMHEDHAVVQKAIEAGEILIWMTDRNALKEVHEMIRAGYEEAETNKDDAGVACYGILASIMAQKLREGWATYAAAHFGIPDLVAVPVYDLFNDDLVNIQHYYFYNDRDGAASYGNFLRQYERSAYNWKIEDKGEFIKISSKSGKQVEIYANKPKRGETGIEALRQYMSSRNIEPQIVVHRGLSTHTLKTFERVPSSARLILDGSCGGFHIQSVALENAPTAHILCNRNIGTMHINDPMFKQISETIRKGEDLVWPDFWKDMEARLGANPYFKDYIPPHKNVAALIIKAYYDVLGI